MVGSGAQRQSGALSQRSQEAGRWHHESPFGRCQADTETVGRAVARRSIGTDLATSRPDDQAGVEIPEARTLSPRMGRAGGIATGAGAALATDGSVRHQHWRETGGDLRSQMDLGA